jgi:acetyl-CoA carboxylase biotin carboxyl carrier protein
VDGAGREAQPDCAQSRALVGATPTNQERGTVVAVEIEAQITGNVWKIEKAVGDPVEEEEAILIIESMKMEIPLEAPCAGRISEIRTAEGESVEEGDILVVLE